MKIGKISENVLKRSVLRYVTADSEVITRGAGIGNDCALFMPCRSGAVGVSALSIKGREQMRHGIYGAVNNLAAQGEIPMGIFLNILLPERAREIKLQEIMQEARDVCDRLQIHILGGHTQTTTAVNRIIVNVTALGNAAMAEGSSGAGEDGLGNADTEKRKSWQGYDIVVSKYIGMEAATLIAGEKEEELLARFPRNMVEEAKAYRDLLSVIPEAMIAGKEGAILMHDIREGGIFGAIWEMAQRVGAGLIIDIKKIPMKQTVVEICNYYDLNPYEILSEGCLLMVAKNGEDLVNALAQQEIPAAVIGRMTDSNDRIIINGDEIRYLDLPKPDQIHKIL